MSTDSNVLHKNTPSIYFEGNSDNYKSNPVCVTGVDFSSLISGALKCKTPLTGRYVSVQLEGNRILTLCEVKVYSDLY